MSRLKRIEFFVPGRPQPKGSWDALPGRGKAKGKTIFRRNNRKEGGWASQVRIHANLNAPVVPWDGPVVACALFHIERPPSHPKTRGTWPCRKPDLDKLARSAFDACTGVIYKDDARIVAAPLAEVYYSSDPGVLLVFIGGVPEAEMHVEIEVNVYTTPRGGRVNGQRVHFGLDPEMALPRPEKPV